MGRFPLNRSRWVERPSTFASLLVLIAIPCGQPGKAYKLDKLVLRSWFPRGLAMGAAISASWPMALIGIIVIKAEMLSRMDAVWKRTLEILTDVKASAHELHSPRLEYLGIAAVMRSFCEEFGQRKGVEIDFMSHNLPSPVPPDISLCLFRVLQEALHNATKHSGVRHCRVQLWRLTNEIHLTVSDSGSGFDPESARSGRGLGLIGMQERLRLLKGSFSIESQPQRGTTIHARVPLSSGSDSIRAAG